MAKIKFIIACLIACLPNWLKRPIYRTCYGYRIGKGVRIGLSPLIGVGSCSIGEHTRIGHFNLFFQVRHLQIGKQTQIGFGNLFRGGDRVVIGEYGTVLRFNGFNAICGPDFLEPVDSRLELGPGVFISANHWLDFSAGIDIGAHSIIGGRHSHFWTHNRQRSRPIQIGEHCYLGSDVKLAPGVSLSPFCIVAIGSVLSGEFGQKGRLIGGNPGREQRELEDREKYLVVRKTRNDIPDEVAYRDLPWDMNAIGDLFVGGGETGLDSWHPEVDQELRSCVSTQ